MSARIPDPNSDELHFFWSLQRFTLRWSIGKPNACLAANEDIGGCPERKAGGDDRSRNR